MAVNVAGDADRAVPQEVPRVNRGAHLGREREAAVGLQVARPQPLGGLCCLALPQHRHNGRG